MPQTRKSKASKKTKRRVVKRKHVGKSFPPLYVHMIYTCGHKHQSLTSAIQCGNNLLRAHGKNSVDAIVYDAFSGCYADMQEQ